MKQFKPAQVIMLPARDNTILKQFQIWKSGNSNNITRWVFKDEKVTPNERKGYCIPQDLYIVSDDKIKDGDWCLNENNNIFQYIGGLLLPTDKKIIATTDTSLKINIVWIGYKGFNLLPQLSQQFIEKYIEEYNKGNIITDVLIELYPTNEFLNDVTTNSPHYKLSINQDNTINIQLPKNNWNREEITKLFHDFGKIATGKQINFGHIPSNFVADELEIDNFLKQI